MPSAPGHAGPHSAPAPPAILVGTAGWRYKPWQHVLYPHDLAPTDWLRFYSATFPCVEVSDSLYGAPDADAIAGWCNDTPETFVFTLLGPRTITESKKLKHCEPELDAFLSRTDAFGARLGPTLFRLPERWRCNLPRLSEFLKRLPRTRRFAFEFRDSSWHEPQVFELLHQHGAALCITDSQADAARLAAPADFVYLRLRGPAEAATDNYRAHTLRGWTGRARDWTRAGKDVYFIFDCNESAYSVKNAARVQHVLTGISSE